MSAETALLRCGRYRYVGYRNDKAMSQRQIAHGVNSYRIFFMDNGGHITGVAEFVCVNDAEAEARAELMRDHRRSELWSLDRLVGAYDPKPDE